VWENRAVFEAWTKSEAFRAAHSRAGDNKPLYFDHPQFEGFEVRQTVKRGRIKQHRVPGRLVTSWKTFVAELIRVPLPLNSPRSIANGSSALD